MSARTLLIALVGGAAVIGVVLVAGGYNVSAAAGHLPPVRALLHFTMRNSVQVRSGAPVPADLDSDARARAGAVHYDLVCRDCHGAPGEPLSAVARHMVPSPPHIVDAVQHWRVEDVFWIVKHGIKMTAMPAWPAQVRDDEVWSVVAFLERLRGDPESANDYRRLAHGTERLHPAREPVANGHLERCARCHGHRGEGMDAWGLPRIDGLTVEYLRASLLAYADGRRASGIMQAQATAVPREVLDELARHYARFARTAPSRSASDADAPWPTGAEGHAGAERPTGAELARQGAPERLIPACAACHGPVEYPRSPRYPALAGQPVSYLETQLQLFRDGARGGSSYAAIMSHAARHLEDADIRALARYYSRLPGQPSSESGVR